MVLESLRVVTECKTVAQFIALFHRFCDARTCFIPTSDTRPVGSSLAFSLQLADGATMLRGACRVKAAWADHHNQYGRPGVQLEILELAPECVPVFELVLASRSSEDESATIETPPLQHEHAAFLLDADLAIPVADVPSPSIREELKTLLGIAPLAPPKPALLREAIPEPVPRTGTQPLVFMMRPPATRSMPMHAMSANERFWYACALAAVLLLAALVFASAVIAAG